MLALICIRYQPVLYLNCKINQPMWLGSIWNFKCSLIIFISFQVLWAKDGKKMWSIKFHFILDNLSQSWSNPCNFLRLLRKYFCNCNPVTSCYPTKKNKKWYNIIFFCKYYNINLISMSVNPWFCILFFCNNITIVTI